MSHCAKGHYYDEYQHVDCPRCRERASSSATAKETILEDDEPRRAPPTDMRDVERSRAARPRTIIDLDDENPRLRGFLVIVSSREEAPYRYLRLTKGVHRLGRFGHRADLEIRDSDVSAEHALVLCTNTATRVIDLDSTNGLYVNGERTEIAALRTGDRFRVGQTTFAFTAFDYVADD